MFSFVRNIFWIFVVGWSLFSFLRQALKTWPPKYLTWIGGITFLLSVAYEIGTRLDSKVLFSTSILINSLLVVIFWFSLVTVIFTYIEEKSVSRLNATRAIAISLIVYGLLAYSYNSTIFIKIAFWVSVGLPTWYIATKIIPARTLTLIGYFCLPIYGALIYFYSLDAFFSINIFDVKQLFSGKSYWELMTEVLFPVLIPLSVTLGGYFIKIGEEKKVYENRKEQALQTYLDKISEIRPGSLTLTFSEIDKEIIKARTSTVLQILGGDKKRKSFVVRFLTESKIMLKIDMDLEGMDLSGVNLEGLNLSGINLAKSNLSRANLTKTILRNADLSGCDLSYVYFNNSDLSDANLCGSNLFGAEFGSSPSIIHSDGATLVRTNFKEAQNLDSSQVKLGKGWEKSFYDKIPSLSANI